MDDRGEVAREVEVDCGARGPTPLVGGGGRLRRAVAAGSEIAMRSVLNRARLNFKKAHGDLLTTSHKAQRNTR